MGAPAEAGDRLPMRTGFTLLELATVLTVVAVAAAGLGPAVGRWGDRAAVVGAREAVAALVAEARASGLGRGGARVHVAARPWRAWSEVDGRVLRSVDLEVEAGVRVDLSAQRERTTLEYDALGVGRVASETLRFRRGGAEAALVVSGYGRVRRR